VRNAEKRDCKRIKFVSRKWQAIVVTRHHIFDVGAKKTRAARKYSRLRHFDSIFIGGATHGAGRADECLPASEIATIIPAARTPDGRAAHRRLVLLAGQGMRIRSSGRAIY
jgi:hypothetical protein